MNEEVKGKKCPQLRFSAFDDEWEEKKLGEISSKVSKKNTDNSITETFTNSAEFGIISQRDFFDHDISNDENIDGYFIVENDDFVYNPRISTIAPVGPINRNKLGRSGVMSPLYYVFRTHDIDKSFLEKYFKSECWYDFMFLNGNSGARSDRFSITDSVFTQMPIRVPRNKLEQQKIGAFLSHVDSLIQAKTKKLESLKAVKKSLLQKCFPKPGEKVPEMRFAGFSGDWEEKKLTDEVELYSGLTYTPKDVEEYGTLVLRSSNVQNGEIELEDNVFVDPKVVNSKNVEKGDIIVVVRNGSRALIGKHAQIKTTMHNTVIGAFMTGIKAPNPEFMNALLSTDAFTREVEINLGATINQITNSTFESMSFYFPKTIEEQQALGSFFSKYDSLISAQQREIDKLKDIKKSLLQKMFV